MAFLAGAAADVRFERISRTMTARGRAGSVVRSLRVPTAHTKPAPLWGDSQISLSDKRVEPYLRDTVIFYQMLPKSHLSLVTPAADSARREPVTFEALFGNYSGYVARLASRLLGSGDAELDDVVQDVFWLASRRIDKIADLIQARGWLATVTTRVVRRKLLRRRFRALFHASPGSGDVPAHGATAE